MLSWPLLLLAPLVEVEWNAPQECPGEEAFVAMVESETDLRDDGDAPPVLTAVVTVVETGPEEWQLTLRLLRENDVETRTFDGDSCLGVVEAAALVVSLRVVEWAPAFVPEPAPQTSPDESEEEVQPRSVARDSAVASPAPRAEPEQPRPKKVRPTRPPISLGGWLGLQAGVALGVGPGVGGAAAVEGGLEGRWWRAGLALQTSPRRFVRHPSDSSVQGRFDLIVAQAFGCGTPHAGPVEFPICARVAGGGLRGAGFGAVGRSEPAWGGWWGLGGSAAAVWHAWDRFAPTISAEALAPLRAWSYSVGDVPGVLHRTGPIAFRAWVGLEIHL